MIDIIEQTDKLIDALNNASFTKNMKTIRDKIIKEGIVVDTNNEIIREYISNQNLFDYHIYYLNSKINNLINNKKCEK